MSLSGEGEVGGTVLLAKAQWENGAVCFCEHVPPLSQHRSPLHPTAFPCRQSSAAGKTGPQNWFYLSLYTCKQVLSFLEGQLAACSPSQTWAGDFGGDGTSMAGPRLSGIVTLDGSQR